MKMTSFIIADSSGLVSLAIEDDSNHKNAKKVLKKYGTKKGIILVSREVLSETLNVIGKKSGHQTAYITASIILNTEAYSIIDTPLELINKTLEMFKTQSNSTSFTDCIVMALADQYETKYIFGFDEVFEKSGYSPA